MDKSQEEVVLYPLKSHDAQVKVLRVARVPEGKLNQATVHHIAGGPYKGIIVSKATQDLPSKDRPHIVREFFAHVHDTKTSRQSHRDTKECRKVFMWFKDGNYDREQIADQFYKNLIDPDHFPKDYISFVKKVIVLTKGYNMIRTIELELSPAEEHYGSPPVSPNYRLSWIAKPENFEQDEIIQEDSPQKNKKAKPAPPPRKSTLQQNGDTNLVQNDIAVNEAPRTSPTSPEQREPEETRTVERIIKHTIITNKSSPPTSAEEKVKVTEEHKSEPWSSPEKITRTERTVEQTSPDTPEGAEVVEVTITKQTVTKATISPPSGPNEEVEDDQGIRTAHRLLVLTVLEDAFPNALDVHQISSSTQLTESQTDKVLEECSEKSLIQQVDGNRWIRISTVRRKPKSESRLSGYSRISSSYTSKHDFQVVPQMPTLPDREQPTVAIITLLYCEKQAVDAMMDTKTTYVRYKTEGEGLVYTVGTIGTHKVVSTKLIRVGSGQGATVSAGNLVTRLLGTFSKVQHVFLVGVGGSVPDYTNDKLHVRCGDVTLSLPQYEGSPTYVSVTDVDGDIKEGNVSFGTQAWEPKDAAMMKIVSDIAKSYSPHSMINSSMNQYMRSALNELEGQGYAFERPSAEADRLYKLGTDGAWSEVDQPALAADSPRRMYPDRPVLHFGSIGAGYDQLVRDGADFRHDFALFNEIKAIDVGYQAVMESIDGNRTESFWIIRGIADYMDGMSSTEWQPYASLAAAVLAKTILMKLAPTRI